MVKPKHDSQWRRAVLGLMKMRNDGMGDEAFNNAIDYMNNLYFAGKARLPNFWSPLDVHT